MTERQIRAEQLEKLKNGIHPGKFIVEKLNSVFVVSKKWEYDTQEEAEMKVSDLMKSGVHPAFINRYAKFTF